MSERIFAEIDGNGVCIRRFWENYPDEAIPLGIVVAMPWHIEGQGVAAAQAAYDAVQAAAVAAAAARQTVINDPLRAALINQLRGATNVQISNYVDANVTDLATARTMLKRVILVLATLVA